MCSGYRKKEGLVPGWSDTRLTYRPPPREWFAARDVDVRPSMLERVATNDEGRTWRELRWAFKPKWAASKPNVKPMINARSETAFEKPTWRDAVARTRCVIVASSWLEWSGPTGKKLLHSFSASTSLPVLLAGVWEPSTGSYAMMTTEPNVAAARVHDRMPVVLQSVDAVDRWLNPHGIVEGDVADLLVGAREGSICIEPPEPYADPQGSLW